MFCYGEGPSRDRPIRGASVPSDRPTGVDCSDHGNDEGQPSGAAWTETPGILAGNHWLPHSDMHLHRRETCGYLI